MSVLQDNWNSVPASCWTHACPLSDEPAGEKQIVISKLTPLFDRVGFGKEEGEASTGLAVRCLAGSRCILFSNQISGTKRVFTILTFARDRRVWGTYRAPTRIFSVI